MSLFGKTLTTDRGVAHPQSPKASTQIAAHGQEGRRGGGEEGMGGGRKRGRWDNASPAAAAQQHTLDPAR